MVRKTIRKSVDRAASNNYRIVAENFYNGAEVAREFEYWNAAGVLIVHSAIAYADAISIKFGSIKSQSDDHYQVVSLLKELIAQSTENKKSLQQLEKIISHKNTVSYSGDIYNAKDIELLWKYIRRFRDWAENLLKG